MPDRLRTFFDSIANSGKPSTGYFTIAEQIRMSLGYSTASNKCKIKHNSPCVL
ncbi:hypothetical protein CUJ84_Chr000482 [Rhizobium leguminosarum]|uniref:Uncharacterized protein n=1 Tax=Rhizobium leguminosarum TaxID=384 RepID=A0A2K9YY43_RHILE|nr:hypothetical protein CUJ84_Chr000482 [Rhizobium leguminosarum]